MSHNQDRLAPVRAGTMPEPAKSMYPAPTWFNHPEQDQVHATTTGYTTVVMQKQKIQYLPRRALRHRAAHDRRRRHAERPLEEPAQVAVRPVRPRVDHPVLTELQEPEREELLAASKAPL